MSSLALYATKRLAMAPRTAMAAAGRRTTKLPSSGISPNKGTVLVGLGLVAIRTRGSVNGLDGFGRDAGVSASSVPLDSGAKGFSSLVGKDSSGDESLPSLELLFVHTADGAVVRTLLT